MCRGFYFVQNLELHYHSCMTHNAEIDLQFHHPYTYTSDLCNFSSPTQFLQAILIHNVSLSRSQAALCANAPLEFMCRTSRGWLGFAVDDGCHSKVCPADVICLQRGYVELDSDADNDFLVFLFMLAALVSLCCVIDAVRKAVACKRKVYGSVDST